MAIWSIVEFVTKLCGLSAEHYKDTVARAAPDDLKKDKVKSRIGRPQSSKQTSPRGGHALISDIHRGAIDCKIQPGYALVI
ncbi:hypothetical protein [Tardiphaga sp.]|uniref:hypothetical protein n=1 Tax=Tardiphaga sp. TaxID=1926292 RepID=UPI00352BA716